ncbi:MAG: alcohol dehydrogenase catalytic domain-containing protein [Caldilineaceae bacterium]
MGDRVILYHISGCGVCNDCREGYMISCTLTNAAYGWQRDGGHADYCLAEESTCVACLSRSPMWTAQAWRLRHRLRGAQPACAPGRGPGAHRGM